MTSDETEALATRLVPGLRASFLDFDTADKLGPAHSIKKTDSMVVERVDLGDADDWCRERLCYLDLRKMKT